MKNPLTPAGIEPATFRFVAQHLNHGATAVPHIGLVSIFSFLANVCFAITPTAHLRLPKVLWQLRFSSKFVL